MFNFLSRKKKEDKKSEPQLEKSEASNETKPTNPAEDSLGRMRIDLERLNTAVEALQEVRKLFMERFTNLSEQIGELRASILDRDKNFQEVELKAIKASDLVSSVQPEKLMTQMQKQEVKIEALKANIEGNEAIMDKIMEELKEARRKIEFFRGVEEIIKLSDEMKKELIEMKKTESNVALNTDKVAVIYSEINKRFRAIDSFDSELQEAKINIKQTMKDIDFLKDKSNDLASKEEVDKVSEKLQNYVDALKAGEKKSSLSKDLETLKGMLKEFKK